MANKKVTIVRLCKTEDGSWKRFPVVMGAKGKIKPNFVWVGKTRTSAGEPVEYPEGRYQIRTYEGKKTVYKDMGNFTDLALAERNRQVQRGAMREQAQAAGLKLVEPEADDESHGRVTLNAAFKQFIHDTESRGSMVSAQKYKVQLREFIDLSGKTYVDQLSKDDVQNHGNRLRKTGTLSDRTLYNRHMNVRCFYKALGFNVAKMLERCAPRFEKKLPQAYTSDELRVFFTALPEGQLKMGFQILLYCGLRKRELTNLEWTNVDLSNGVLRVRSNPRTAFQVKDFEQRDITIPDELLERMRLYHRRKPNDILVMETRRGEPYEGMLKACKKYSDLGGLACGQCHGCRGTAVRCDRWFLHKFRATYITKLCQSGMPLRDVMMLSGHSKLENVERYLAPASSERIRAQVNAVKWL